MARMASISGVMFATDPVIGEVPSDSVKWSNRCLFPKPGAAAAVFVSDPEAAEQSSEDLLQGAARVAVPA